MPAPTAAPLTAAMYGFSISATSRGMRCTPSRRKLRFSTGVRFSFWRPRSRLPPRTSAPVQKPRCAGAGDDDDARVGVCVGVPEGLVPLLDHLCREGVHTLRAVEGDRGDAVLLFVDDLLEIHRLPPGTNNRASKQANKAVRCLRDCMFACLGAVLSSQRNTTHEGAPPMKFGTLMFPTEYSIDPVSLGKAVEERGFDSIFFPDHTHIPASRRTPWPGGTELPKEYYNCYDVFTALTAVAVTSPKLLVGTGVCLIMERDPIQTANEIASIDLLSGGRFIFGVGGGWNEEEMENHGTDPKRRFKVMRERIEAMKEIWTKDEAEYHGEFVNFDPIWSWPKPVQKPHPPIYVGGDGPNTLKRVVAYGDAWMPIPGRGEVPMSEKIKQLQQMAADAGRGPIPVTDLRRRPAARRSSATTRRSASSAASSGCRPRRRTKRSGTWTATRRWRRRWRRRGRSPGRAIIPPTYSRGESRARFASDRARHCGSRCRPSARQRHARARRPVQSRRPVRVCRRRHCARLRFERQPGAGAGYAYPEQRDRRHLLRVRSDIHDELPGPVD